MPQSCSDAARRGRVEIPGAEATGAFAAASYNAGIDSVILAVAGLGIAQDLPVSMLLCQTDPATAQCLATPTGPGVTTQIRHGVPPTFSVFVAGHGTVPFDAASNRIYVRFIGLNGLMPGATSVAENARGAGTLLRSGSARLAPTTPPTHLDRVVMASAENVAFVDPFRLGPSTARPL